MLNSVRHNLMFTNLGSHSVGYCYSTNALKIPLKPFLSLLAPKLSHLCPIISISQGLCILESPVSGQEMRTLGGDW